MITQFRLAHDCNSTVLVDISTSTGDAITVPSTTSSAHRIRSLFSARPRDIRTDITIGRTAVLFVFSISVLLFDSSLFQIHSGLLYNVPEKVSQFFGHIFYKTRPILIKFDNTM